MERNFLARDFLLIEMSTQSLPMNIKQSNKKSNELPIQEILRKYVAIYVCAYVHAFSMRQWLFVLLISLELLLTTV
jgi:hypothetical protein